MKSTSSIWNEHYNRVKSRLLYPDENLVRILAGLDGKDKKALDFGAGSGRHSVLLKNHGYKVTALDYTENSLKIIQEIDNSIETVIATNPPYQFKDSIFDLIVSWGVLHYNSTEEIKKIVREYIRILNKDGHLAGTIRADRDTYLGIKNGIINTPDLEGAKALLFSKDDVITIFQEFSDLKLGYMERTPIGKLEEKISHWIFLCKK